MKKLNQRVCVVAAGSGGHILPTIALAKTHSSLPLVAISRNAPLENKLFATQSSVEKTLFVNLLNIRQKGLLYAPLFIAQAISVFFKSLFFLRKEKVDTVITTGGYVAIPVFGAAWILGIKRISCELNYDLGVTIKFLKFLSNKIYCTFPETKKSLPAHKSEFIPYPVRFNPTQRSISKNDALSWINKQLAGSTLPFAPHKKTLFILGGSQGSRALNSLLMATPLRDSQVQVIHQAGNADLEELTNFYRANQIPHFVFPYLEKIEYCYCAADLVITRAGAGSLFELLFFNKPAIIIPLEGEAGNHQLTNAQSFVSRHPAHFKLLRQKLLKSDPHALKKLLEGFN